MVLGGLEYRGHRDVFSSVYNSIRTGPLDEALLKMTHRFFHRDNLLLRTFTYPCLTTSIPGVSIVLGNTERWFREWCFGITKWTKSEEDKNSLVAHGRVKQCPMVPTVTLMFVLPSLWLRNVAEVLWEERERRKRDAESGMEERNGDGEEWKKKEGETSGLVSIGTGERHSLDAASSSMLVIHNFSSFLPFGRVSLSLLFEEGSREYLDLLSTVIVKVSSWTEEGRRVVVTGDLWAWRTARFGWRLQCEGIVKGKILRASIWNKWNFYPVKWWGRILSFWRFCKMNVCLSFSLLKMNVCLSPEDQNDGRLRILSCLLRHWLT